jgi:hypothetical protein
MILIDSGVIIDARDPREHFRLYFPNVQLIEPV